MWRAWPPKHGHPSVVDGTDDATYATRARFNSVFAGGPLRPSSAGWRRGNSPVRMWS